MSMKKLAVLTTYHNYGGLNVTEMHPTPASPPAPVHGVNVMLGGAMISGIILVVFILCYCCHKTQRKSQAHTPPYWRDPGLSMEIYTVEAQNCFSMEDYATAEIHHHHYHHHLHRSPTQTTITGPPPAYEVVVPMDKTNTEIVDESGLPSYESVVKLEVANANRLV